ncbi:MAG TPA: hypothetical protein VF260_01630 [Bacilli bacterium]
MNSHLSMDEESIRRYIGQQICVVLCDETCFNGKLNSLCEGELILQNFAQGKVERANEAAPGYSWITKGIGFLASIPVEAVAEIYAAVETREIIRSVSA